MIFLLSDILERWRPGSYEWSWFEEANDLIFRDSERLKIIESRISLEGWEFSQDPILLGSDGRVWDGHHRIVIAMMQGILYLPCVSYS